MTSCTPHLYSASDYAGMSACGYSFYYGYEEEKDGQWAFVMKKGDKELLRYSATELSCRSGDDPKDGLLSGICKAIVNVIQES